ncbi:MAG: hypothetical protein L3J24_07020 [Xanthomonadales bacterium]|nr:hypothetical protein [Xanthomonadales bacterium]
MKKNIVKGLLLLLFVSVLYAGVNSPVLNQQGSSGKFVPTEKLRADDTVAFPIDI